MKKPQYTIDNIICTGIGYIGIYATRVYKCILVCRGFLHKNIHNFLYIYIIITYIDSTHL